MLINTRDKLYWNEQTREALAAAKKRDLVGAKAVVVAAMSRAEKYAAHQILSRLIAREITNHQAVQTMLIKPVGDTCNIACSYCYQAGLRPTKTATMSISELETILTRVLSESSGPLLIYVHGGEPLLAGREWFQALTTIVYDHDRAASVEFGLQTNGTLLDERWAQFLVEHNFNIGLSLDGPPNYHDMSRVDHAARGTHRRVLAALRLLQAHHARHGVTAVVTHHVARLPSSMKNLLRFFIDEGVTQFDVHPAWSPQSALKHHNLQPPEYARVMGSLFDEWLALGRTDVLIRTFEFFFQSMARARPAACHRAGACMSILGVEPDGRVVPCVRPFSSEYSFGNLIVSSLTTVLNSEAYRRFESEEERGRQRNAPCRWHHLCGGGCPHERYSGDRHAVNGVHAYCTCDTNHDHGYPGLFEHIYRRVSEVLVG